MQATGTTTLCSWCGASPARDARGQRRISHVICGSCVAELLSSLRAVGLRWSGQEHAS